MAGQTRTQISWNGPDDPLLIELAQEAELRGITLAQHIYDLLRSRFLARRGVSLAELLGAMPGTIGPAQGSAEASAGQTGPQAATSPSQAENDRPPEAARMVANAWAGLLSED